MPSSHGGGSSGGGSHSSGGHSSGGRGGSRGPRVSRRSFRGSTYYDYYRPGGRYVGFYYKGRPKRQSVISQVVSLIITVLFFTIFILSMKSTIQLPIKLSSSKIIPTEAYYEDHIGIIKDKASFTEPLEEFYKKTGVQPFVYLFPAEEFPSTYGQLDNDTLENYAYNIYVNQFNDEGHFLIVYTQDESGQLWYWCDMSGDDTGGVINDSFWNDFQSDMQKYLNRNSFTTEEAIRTTFESSLDYALSWKSLKGYLPIAAMLLFMLGIAIIPQILAIRNARMINEYLEYQNGQTYHEYDASNNPDGYYEQSVNDYESKH